MKKNIDPTPRHVHTLYSLLEQLRYELANGPEGCGDSIVAIGDPAQPGECIMLLNGNGSHSIRTLANEDSNRVSMCLFNPSQVMKLKVKDSCPMCHGTSGFSTDTDAMDGLSRCLDCGCY